MKTQPVKINTIEHATHDVLHIVLEKPDDIEFVPGQATEFFVDRAGKSGTGNPFTFTSLPEDPYLEFMIKTYPENNGFTARLLTMHEGDEIILNDVFGAIAYKGEGTFIAGGAGVTPFIAILRQLRSQDQLGNNRLLFANKTREDIILQDEFDNMLGDNFINILSKEKTDKYAYGMIDKEFIAKNCLDTSGYFYVCGPPPMMDAVEKYLAELKVDKDKIVKEAF